MRRFRSSTVGAIACLALTFAGSTALEPRVTQQVADSAHAGYTSRDFVGDWTCQVYGGWGTVTAFGTVRSDGTSVNYGIVNGNRTPNYKYSWSYSPKGPTTGTMSVDNRAFYRPTVGTLSPTSYSFSSTESVHWRSPNRYAAVTLTDTNVKAIGSRTYCSRNGSTEKDDCAEVKQFIQQSEHFRDQYNDPSLIAQAKANHWTGGQFENAVQAKDKADAKAIEDVGATAGYTDTNNCVIHLNAAALAKNGFLQVEIDSMLVHEKVHQSDCQSAKKNGTQDTWQFDQKTENDAYNADIAYLLKWVSANC
jgi:hypothetical protein